MSRSNRILPGLAPNEAGLTLRSDICSPSSTKLECWKAQCLWQGAGRARMGSGPHENLSQRKQAVAAQAILDTGSCSCTPG